jgi:hypothetical protein
VVSTVAFKFNLRRYTKACTSGTYGGGKGTDGTLYTYPMDVANSYKSVKNVAASKKIKEDATGAQFKSPGHSGNFYLEFTKAGPLYTSPLFSSIRSVSHILSLKPHPGHPSKKCFRFIRKVDYYDALH